MRIGKWNVCVQGWTLVFEYRTEGCVPSAGTDGLIDNPMIFPGQIFDLNKHYSAEDIKRRQEATAASDQQPFL